MSGYKGRGSSGRSGYSDSSGPGKGSRNQGSSSKGGSRSRSSGSKASGNAYGSSQSGSGHTRRDYASRGGGGKGPDGQSREQGGSRQRGGANPNAIFGKRSVIEALEAGVPLQGISLAEGLSQSDAVERIRELARYAGVSVDSVPRSLLDGRACGINHQGVMAVAKPYRYSSIMQISESVSGSPAALVYVLDHITDVGNFGAIVRTAEVVGACGIVIPNRRSVEVTPAVYKTSSGAVSRMKVAMVPNVASACDELRDSGFWIAGASEKAEESCWDSPLDGKIAVVMGNEENGISNLVQRKCDFLAKLPQRGSVGSLNVSCAAAAMGYEWMRQNMAKGNLEMETPDDGIRR